MKIEESLNVTFDESHLPPKTSPLEDDDLVKEEAIKVSEKKPLGNDVEDESLEIDKIHLEGIWRKYTRLGLNLGRNGTRLQLYMNLIKKHLTMHGDVIKISPNDGKPQQDDTGFVNSGCSRHMTGNIAYLSDFKEFDGGLWLRWRWEHMVIEFLMCDKKNYVLFTNTECLVLSPNFKLPDESQILLKIPRKDNMYSFDMKNIVPKESLTCLVAKATSDESMLWHRRLGQH
ncbi:hypothetical protein Tco_1226792 [Tanacetum coccineum]